MSGWSLKKYGVSVFLYSSQRFRPKLTRFLLQAFVHSIRRVLEMGRLHRVEALGLDERIDFAQEWVVLDELDEREHSHCVEDVLDPRGVFGALEEPQGLAKGEVPHYVESGKVHHLAQRHWLTGGFSQFRDEQVDILVEQGLLLP